MNVIASNRTFNLNSRPGIKKTNNNFRPKNNLYSNNSNVSFGSCRSAIRGGFKRGLKVGIFSGFLFFCAKTGVIQKCSDHLVTTQLPSLVQKYFADGEMTIKEIKEIDGLPTKIKEELINTINNLQNSHIIEERDDGIDGFVLTARGREALNNLK